MNESDRIRPWELLVMAGVALVIVCVVGISAVHIVSVMTRKPSPPPGLPKDRITKQEIANRFQPSKP